MGQLRAKSVREDLDNTTELTIAESGILHLMKKLYCKNFAEELDRMGKLRCFLKSRIQAS